MENQLIVVKQLPIIEESLKALKTEIKAKVDTANALVCTPETIKSVKGTRSELNKQYKGLEAMRKDVKSKVMGPYMAFEDIYKDCVTNQFKQADSSLKIKIAEVEDEVKKEKEEKVKTYFNEYLAEFPEIDFIEYYQAGIKVNLSASLKSLKAQGKEFIDQIVSDLELIDTQGHKFEILTEYKQTLNCSQSIKTVVDRFKRLEITKAKATAPKPVKKVNNTPFEQAFESMFKDDEEEITGLFTITAPESLMMDLKQFMNERKIKWEEM